MNFKEFVKNIIQKQLQNHDLMKTTPQLISPLYLKGPLLSKTPRNNQWSRQMRWSGQNKHTINIYTVDACCYSLSNRLARLLASIIRSTLDPPCEKRDQLDIQKSQLDVRNLFYGHYHNVSTSVTVIQTRGDTPTGHAHTLTLLLMRSICRFCDSISLPMSMAMFLRLPSMPLTCVKFSSISSSLASLVILSSKTTLLYSSTFSPTALKSLNQKELEPWMVKVALSICLKMKMVEYDWKTDNSANGLLISCIKWQPYFQTGSCIMMSCIASSLPKYNFCVEIGKISMLFNHISHTP